MVPGRWGSERGIAPGVEVEDVDGRAVASHRTPGCRQPTGPVEVVRVAIYVGGVAVARQYRVARRVYAESATREGDEASRAWCSTGGDRQSAPQFASSNGGWRTHRG